MVEKNKPSEQEVKDMLTKRQSEWVNDGNEWSKGFVQGVEYILNLSHEKDEEY